MQTIERKRKKHRRGNGEGSVFERNDGRWAATITVGYTATGKRKRRTVYAPTKTDVLAKLATLAHEKVTGTITEPTTATVADYLNDWLKNSAKPAIRVSTYVQYESVVRANLIPIIGGVRLSKLRPEHVQALYAALVSQKLASRTIRKIAIVLKRALSQAERFRLIHSNPARLVSPPKVEHREMRVLTAEQARKFLDEAQGDRCWPLFVVAVHTGMRQAELLGLQWDDVSFSRKTITVARTATYVAHDLVIGSPKTKRSARTIDASKTVLEALGAQRAMVMREGLASCPWVFPSQAGEVQKANTVKRRHFSKILKAAELPKVRFHDLRHTAASLMLQAGINPKIISERLGHSSIGITLDTYGHIMPGMGRDASDRLDAVLSGAVGCQLAVKEA
jgi:integrase